MTDPTTDPAPTTSDHVGGGGETLNGYKFRFPGMPEEAPITLVVMLQVDGMPHSYAARHLSLASPGETEYYTNSAGNAPYLPLTDSVMAMSFYPGSLPGSDPNLDGVFAPTEPIQEQPFCPPMTPTNWQDGGHGVVCEYALDSESGTWGWKWTPYTG